MAPFVNTSSWIPAAVLLASLLGSGHCVAMCGGLVVASTHDRRSWVSYHLGRLGGYLLLGAIAGWLGGQMLGNPQFTMRMNVLSWVTSFLIAGMFLIIAVRVWKGMPTHFTIIPQRFLSMSFGKAQGRPMVLGLLTAFLPCGWLHVFVLGAVTSTSAVAGAGFLFAFWLGTLPALGVARWLSERLFRSITRRFPKMAALILVVAGVLSLGMKMAPSFFISSQASERHHCHSPN